MPEVDDVADAKFGGSQIIHHLTNFVLANGFDYLCIDDDFVESDQIWYVFPYWSSLVNYREASLLLKRDFRI